MRSLNLIKSIVCCVVGKRGHGGRPVTIKGGDGIKVQPRKESWKLKQVKQWGWREQYEMAVDLLPMRREIGRSGSKFI